MYGEKKDNTSIGVDKIDKNFVIHGKIGCSKLLNNPKRTLTRVVGTE